MKSFLVTSLAASVVTLLLVGGYVSKAGTAPAGQPPMVDINDQTLSALKAEFNRQAASTRVILLLSPTCPTCLQGSTAIERVLKSHLQTSVVVFAVWEPMLPTDWSKPGTSVLKRLGDKRVRQFWDPNHVVAVALKKREETGQLHPNCCTRNGFLWDLIAAYAPDAQWKDTLPEPILFNGTMVEATDALEAALAKAK